MLYIAVCDDEPVITGRIEEQLFELAKEMKIKIDVSVFFDGATLEQNISQGNEYQLIYLDIEMKKIGGIDVAKSLRSMNSHALIIYVSSYESYAKDLFEVDAFRFLNKPINKEKFKEYFTQAVKRLSDRSEYYEFIHKRERYTINIRDICYFESCKRIIYIHTGEQCYQFYGKLNDVEKCMHAKQNSFIRIHQSYLVNYNYIKVIGNDYVELTDGGKIQVSEERQKGIRQEYCHLLGREAT